jgi:AraC family ethanolamine operon transcriptional activator
MALRGKATFCRRQCDGTQLHVFSGADAFEFLSPCGLDIAGFVLTESDLEAALTCDERETLLPSLAEPHLRSTDGGAADLMRRMFADACEVVALCPDLADDPKRLASMSRDVVATLVTALSRAPGNRPDIPPGKRARIVRDARDLVNAWPDGDMSIAELCRTLGVSRRGLQYAFQETLGIKPSAYLRAVRLNGARRAIKHTHSVAEAATHWGFWHFGRFAHDYKAMFGELPSEAFRRYHAGTPKIPDDDAAAGPGAQRDHRR